MTTEADPLGQMRGEISALHREVFALISKRLDDVDRLASERDLRYDQRFKAQTEGVSTALTAAEKAVAAALQAADRAVLKAEGSAEKRFESVNEFRSSLNDMVSRLIPREEADQRFGALREKLDTLRTSIDKHEAAGGGMKDGWLYLIGAVGLAATVMSIINFFAK